MAGHGEKTMEQILEKLNQVVEKNEEMESEILRCQDEIVAMKRSKLDLKRKYDQTAKEVKRLKATINDMKSLSPTPAGDTDMTTMTELASVRNDIKNVQDDIEDMKTDVSKISVSVQEVSNLKTETSTLKAKVNHQEQQLQLQQQLMQQPPGAVAASLPVKKLKPEELEKIQKDSEFYVCAPSIRGGLPTGEPTRVWKYRYIGPESPYVNMDIGVYKTPVQGKYTFAGRMGQEGSGKMSLFVCGERKGRRELSVTTDRPDIFLQCGKDVSWECEEGECVWLEVVRTEGEAELIGCGFEGRLME